ncbi:alpha/beta hydrolase [Chryseobacterium paridis]|uniref:Alpha/beta fold hydrolase n=1 Tax=Chryseobacterium paridis TaxID=2800328 RepID=A0ABS1FWE2_9FLAO|nr:alpha/beta fold hydrolase [Chryseobacterium paridis]MBK1896742.1 alpha/beta fold hydrolase [Chryseobacterium paridis]
MDITKQTELIFEPIPLSQDYQFELPENVEEVSIQVTPEVILHGLYYKTTKSPLLLVYFQGNAKNMQNFFDNHGMILDWGYNVLVTDYRGFGKSTGSIDGEQNMYSDAEHVYDFALQLGYQPENIILYGYSMGTSMAAYLATKKRAKAVILESPYSSIAEISIFGNQAPDYQLNTAKRAHEISIPTLLIHGELDDIITPDHSERILANLVTPQKEMIVISKGGHGDLKGREEYQTSFKRFISKL